MATATCTILINQLIGQPAEVTFRHKQLIAEPGETVTNYLQRPDGTALAQGSIVRAELDSEYVHITNSFRNDPEGRVDLFVDSNAPRGLVVNLVVEW